MEDILTNIGIKNAVASHISSRKSDRYTKKETDWEIDNARRAKVRPMTSWSDNTTGQETGNSQRRTEMT